MMEVQNKNTDIWGKLLKLICFSTVDLLK